MAERTFLTFPASVNSLAIALEKIQNQEFEQTIENKSRERERVKNPISYLWILHSAQFEVNSYFGELMSTTPKIYENLSRMQIPK